MLILLLLFVIVSAERVEKGVFSHFELPRTGYADGSILTIFFRHKSETTEDGAVSINFLDEASVTDIPKFYMVHIRLFRSMAQAVLTNEYSNETRTWMNAMSSTKSLLEKPPVDGWWRLDILKFGDGILNLFYQGFWMDVHRVAKTLGKTKSIYIKSKDIDHDSIHIVYIPPEGNLKKYFNEFAFKLALGEYSSNDVQTFGHFKDGEWCYITAFLPSHKTGPPAIVFKTKTEVIFSIYQEESEEDVIDLYIMSSTNRKKTECTKKKKDGHLQHMRVHRDREEIELTLYYQNEHEVIRCRHEVPDIAKLDNGVTVTGQLGTTVLSMQMNSARNFELSRVDI